MDSIDLKIVSALQDNGRITNVELAKMSNLAPSSMLERVRRLEERGVIKRYQVVLDAKKIGYTIEAMIMLCLDRHQASGIEDFEAAVAAVAEVKACFHVAGRYDYVLHVVVRDIDHLGDLVRHKLGSLRGVEKLETFLTLSTVKEDKGYSFEPLTTTK